MTTTFTPRLMDHQLPNNATRYERTLASQVDRLLDLDTDRLRNLWNPWEAHPDDLPYLAWALSVDVWNSDWDVLKKRKVIADAITMHRLKGTRAGLDMAVETMGGKIISAIVPPSSLFLSPNYTEQEKADFLSRQPQLRVFPFRDRGQKIGFMPGNCVRPHTDGGRKWMPVRSDAEKRASPRAFLYKNGVETELATLDRRLTTETQDIDEFIEVREHGKALPGQFVKNFKIWPRPSTAAKRIYTIHTQQTFQVPGKEKLSLQYAKPSLDPIDVKSDLVFQTGTRKAMYAGSGFLGTKSWRSFAQKSTAREHIYHRVYLFDPDTALLRRGGTSFAGFMRLGMPPHYAELKVKIRNKRSKLTFSRFVHGFTMAEDKKGFNDVIGAIRTHKRLTDNILIDTKTIQTLTARPGIKAGVYRAGQLVEKT